MVGRRLRQYLITASLGRGGMGEVWLARDTTLERDVAIKTLPAADDEDAATRKERFVREARAASALNHPNIITIYEINTDQDVDFIAMEYVEGRTLADLLQQGPLPIERVRRIAQQIADAVGQAHHAGIVHRDLKPRNIMVTHTGLVKVLDFGLAKLTRAGGAGAVAQAATQITLTRAGTTVGTLGYMSPEQAIGDPVDARSDVFSFGVILYEMVTGRLPFSGATLSEMMRQLHFTEPPPLESLRADVPASLRRIVSRAMRKRPDDRFATMNDVAAALTAETATTAAKTVVTPASTPTPRPPAPAPLPQRSAWSGTRLTSVGLLGVVLAALIGIAVRRAQTPIPAVVPVAKNDTPAVQATVPAPVQPATKSADQPADQGAVQTAAPRPPAAPPVPRVEPGATSHLHWGKLGDAYRAEPGRQADAATAYRRAIELVDEQIGNTPGDADLHSWRALYLAKLGDRVEAVAAIDPLVKRTDLTAETVFRMAVAYEIAGARQRALVGVSRAVRAGYPPKNVLSDPELAALRSDPRFQRLANATPARKRPRP
jgi:serine/threonine-protein kinase